MNSKNLIIICIAIIAITAIGSFIALNINTAKETNLEVLSNSSLYPGEEFKVKLADDENPIAGQSLFVTFKDANGNLNTFNLETNEEGIAVYNTEDLESGNYTVEITYAGNDDFKSANATSNLEIKNKVVVSETPKAVYKSTSTNTDPDYDASRDASHQHATADNPVTVQQSDGIYTYYGPGHYDYYAGDNHMSGEFYKSGYKNFF